MLSPMVKACSNSEYISWSCVRVCPIDHRGFSIATSNAYDALTLESAGLGVSDLVGGSTSDLAGYLYHPDPTWLQEQWSTM
jgi:hypothetical protein